MFCRPKILPYVLLHLMVWYSLMLYRMIEVYAVRSPLSAVFQLHRMVTNHVALQEELLHVLFELNPSENPYTLRISYPAV